MADGVRGVDDLTRVAAALKQAGDGQLRRDTLAAIRKEGKPTVDSIKARGLASIPSRGGLAAQVAVGVGIRTSLSSRSASVRIARTRRQRRGAAEMLDRAGLVRHPVWGNRGVWVSQSVPAALGWFTVEAEKHAPKFRDSIEDVLVDTAQKIARSV